jgi:hypothetical protein
VRINLDPIRIGLDIFSQSSFAENQKEIKNKLGSSSVIEGPLMNLESERNSS